MHSKEEILSAFEKKYTEVYDFILQQPAELFEEMPGGKWSAGQHIDHLTRSIKPLNLAYRLPGFVLRLMFGKPGRPSRSFDGLVEKYKTKLASGYGATGSFVPPVISLTDKEKTLKEFKMQNETLCRVLEKWDDSKFDNYLLPHPLLGKLTLREMMFFTVYHNEHHLQTLKQRITDKL